MPSGFGIYDLRRPTTAEQQVLHSVPFAAGSPNDLARSATAAVAGPYGRQRPELARHKAPLVTAHPASATRGKPATLHFDLFDDSGHTSALVRIYEQRTLVATLNSPDGFKIGTRNVSVRWPSRASSGAGNSASASSRWTLPGTEARRPAPRFSA